jgi:hypothetical protein
MLSFLESGEKIILRRRCGEMADAPDLKSVGIYLPCRFESGQRHTFFFYFSDQKSPELDRFGQLFSLGSKIMVANHPKPGYSCIITAKTVVIPGF